VSAAGRRSILVGGGAPPVKKEISFDAGAARRWRPKHFFERFPKQFSFYPNNFLMTLFLVIDDRKLQQNRYTAKAAAAAARRSTKVVGGANKLSAAAAWPAQGSMPH